MSRGPFARRFGRALATFVVAVGVLDGAVAAAPDPSASVEVVCRDPEGYADAGSDPAERRRTLEALSAWLRVRSATVVPAGDHLVVTITGLDRAGRDLPSTRRPDADIRIVRDFDATSIDLDFQLADVNGAVLKEGGRHLGDLGMPADLLSGRGDSLGREKSLLRRWLVREFGAGARGGPPP